MQTVAFRLQVVTPLFLSGADQQKAELRSPSIRGALRFWFRAMMGGVVDGDWQKVKRLEALAFGSTEQGSNWQVKVGESTLKLLSAQEAVGPLDEGVLYLGFNLFRRGRRPRGRPAELDKLERACFWPSEGESFRLRLRFFGSDPSFQSVILGAFWLLLHCGGLGARIRRGFGGLALADGEAELAGLRWGWPLEDTLRFFHEQLSKIAVFYAKFAEAHGISTDSNAPFRRSSRIPSFSCFARWKGVAVRPQKGAWESWEEALGALGKELRAFRQDPNAQSRFGATHDYQVIAPFLDSSLSEVQDLKYDAFGLPIQYRSMSRTNQAQKQAEAEAVQKGLSEEEARKRARRLQVRAILQAEQHTGARWETLDRRASPLFVRAIPFQDGTYGGLLLFFRGRVLALKGTRGAERYRRRLASVHPQTQPYSDQGSRFDGRE